MVEILCPHCEDEIELDDGASGGFECPHCEGEFEWGVSSSFSGDNKKYIPVGILTFVVIFSLVLVFSSGWGTISEDGGKGSFSLSEVEIKFDGVSMELGYGEVCDLQQDAVDAGATLDSDDPDYCGLNVTSWIVKVILWIAIICLIAAIVMGGIALSNDVRDDRVIILARVGSGLLFLGAFTWAVGSAISFGDMWGWAFYVTVLMSAIGAIASELESGLLQNLLGIEPD